MKKVPGTQKYTVILETEVVETLDDLFRGLGVSRNEIIRAILKRVVNRLTIRTESIPDDEYVTVNTLIDQAVGDLNYGQSDSP